MSCINFTTFILISFSIIIWLGILFDEHKNYEAYSYDLTQHFGKDEIIFAEYVVYYREIFIYSEHKIYIDKTNQIRMNDKQINNIVLNKMSVRLEGEQAIEVLILMNLAGKITNDDYKVFVNYNTASNYAELLCNKVCTLTITQFTTPLVKV